MTPPASAKEPSPARHREVRILGHGPVFGGHLQIAARHADPRTTMRYDRARRNLDRHPQLHPAAYMASGT